ncbi:MAG: peptidoglycan DD-metalloendopeptidase family protein [Candidatus Moduliflexus flocculans]|nr:peptidoglycan DD-metalloendopeptidase family protein [Candidatus Moduliflexus flocculans]
MRDAGAAVGVGRYDEARAIYTTGAFAAGGSPTAERRTVHLGIDLSVPPGSAVRAPLDGTVHVVAENAAPKDYGPLVILRHAIPSGEEFFTLYGHLDRDSVAGLAPGTALRAGQALRGRRRPARERRLVAARPRPDHPGPSRSRRGFPRRRCPGPALALDRPLPGPQPDPGHPRRPLSRPGTGQDRRPWPRAGSSSAATSASPTASP